jgi:glycosyltransferase involved in cell wall biosynthesis
MIKVSIITVCYNSAETIESTILSVASQTYTNIEYIIIDGASKDNTIEIIKRNESKISKWISEKDAGIYDAMNKGIALASGDIIGILNADDVFANENVIENIVKCFIDSNVEGVYADLKYVRKDNLQKVIRYWKSGSYTHGKFLYGWMPPHPTLYVRKEVYTKFGAYRLDMPSAADYEFMLRVIHVQKIKLAYFPEVVILMREGGLSNSSIKHRIKANRDDKRAWYLNNVKPRFYTLLLKPLLKVFQFVTKS